MRDSQNATSLVKAKVALTLLIAFAAQEDPPEEMLRMDIL